MPDDEKMARSKKLIEENLRQVYEEVLNEEVPDRFKDLLNRLKSSDKKSQDSQ